MRFLFLLVLAANLILLAYGQGFFGAPPSEQGREPRQLLQESNTQNVTFGPALETKQVTR
jgi:hypothetical protein